MASQIVLQALGLNLSPNQISAPEGSLIVAKDLVIRRDNVVESRRGFKLDGDTFGSVSDTLKQLFSYKSRILRHYNSVLQFEDSTNNDGTRKFSTFNGSIIETSDGLRMKSIQANGNFYFTTSEGIKKLSARTGNDLSTNSGYVTRAGGVKAVDINSSLSITDGDSTGFLPQDSAVAYRAVWGIKDLNDNLILGTPSQRTVVFNYLNTLLLHDYNRLLGALDDINQSGSLITDGDYTSSLLLPKDASALDLQTNILTLASKIDTDILYANDSGIAAPMKILSSSITSGVCTVTFNLDPVYYLPAGSRVFLSGFIATGGNGEQINGYQTVTPAGTSITFTTTSTATGIAISGAKIASYEYRYIINNGTTDFPDDLSALVLTTPTSDADLLVIQDTLDRIIIRAQAEPSTYLTYANSTGTSVPLTISAASISAGTCTITFSSGDPTTYLIATSSVILSGFTVSGGNAQSINKTQTIASLTSTTLTFSTTSTATSINFISGIITSIPVISSSLQTAYISPLDITTTASVDIQVTIPEEVTTNHFLQLYRSGIAQATGTTVLSDLTPDDEMQLIYEAFPISTELSAASMTITDITPDEFRGAYLYTNENSGEGALQANDIPPFAKDVNSFKNTIFFANTKTRHRLLFSLLGITEIIDDYGNSLAPQITIASGSTSNTYYFITGRQQVTQVTCVADTADSLNGKYFLLNSAENKHPYYVWYKTSGGSTSDPAVAGRTGIKVLVTTGDTATNVATKTRDTFNRYFYDFTVVKSAATILDITNVDVGYTTSGAAGTSTFTVTTPTSGRGERASTKEVLLSSNVSVGIAVDETAKSLVRVVNMNSSDVSYLYYISGTNSIPGQMLLESRDLSDDSIYIVGNTANVGAAFNPDISPELTISSIVLGAPGVNVITTSAAHGLIDGDTILISGTTTTPNINGLWAITYVSTTTFRINTTITVGDAVLPVGAAISANNAAVSSNETVPNRVYYSKTDQPEAVPITNYFDVGASDKEILRICPLRDSLFVFKEDGLFRVSGETAPWTKALFDSSFNLIAPDSLSVCNSEIYCWTTQGVSKLSEGGATPSVSRPIDTEILKLATSQYTNFSTVTFGTGYESDNSYLVWTVVSTDDDIAQICYRYNTLTNTWTTYDKTNTCALVNPADDKLYLGAGDINSMESERKDFTRYDYADREIEIILDDANYISTQLKFSSVDDFAVGDVLVQEQTVTVYNYNSLLKKLDNDNSVVDSDYYSTLHAVAGDNMRDKLVALATKLDADTGVSATNYVTSIDSKTGSISSASIASPTVITTSSAHGLLTNRYVQIDGTNATPDIDGNFAVTVTGASTFTIVMNVRVAANTGTFTTLVNTFADMKACYNIIIDKLNADSGVAFSNYKPITHTTIQEVIVSSVARNSLQVTVESALDFVVGDMLLYKAIDCILTYAPQVMGDPLSLKHVREATMMFENKAFSTASLSFATDLLPRFNEIEFSGDGVGIFGANKFGTGFFGGGSNSAPFRTYIPKDCQRCRYMVVKFNHAIAREQFAIFGISLTTVDTQSTRAYR